MNTTALELKINAIQIIRDLVHHSEKNFEDFIAPTVELLVELIEYPYSYVIRKTCL